MARGKRVRRPLKHIDEGLPARRRWHDGRPQTAAVVEFFNRAGCPAELMRLQDKGIRGNGALSMMETNQHEVFDIIRAWIESKIESKTD